ncbi:hydrolase TatD [Candidatus Kaiserbacteria bacterium CG10_big_fil_rev_8_21_14_0_10_49_17]|uniref:Hydrolase TatD n=1 Tax=Candidatus Kaiserbacteria bacterium CG10_big_fil_rev_8_21_14_0_10_49_17 TaxID=1974609 RepID=A0A2M6WDR2_9BACT|nr:MAG: hydrolase TatD [Candidatus Kaiserbacteria bacterium CG10_big_fil_rev_8_21_14_0_10_49_17]
MKYEYVDIHCHIAFPQYEADREEVLSRMREKNIFAITIGTDAARSSDALAFAELHSDVYATAGLHPADNSEESFDPYFYGDLVKSEKVVMVGECGLDYFHGKGEKEHARQQEEFEKQIEFALVHDMPLMLHVRDAHNDACVLLERYAKKAGSKLRGNSHFFTGTLEEAKRYWNIGFTTSFPGIITFTHDYDDVLRNAPKELILSETDAPYATPVPHRGKRNEPSFLPLIVARMAEIRGEDEEMLKEQLLRNASALTGINLLV